MKPQRLLRACLGLLCATSGASAQGVVSQLGGFSEQVQSVPVQAANPLSLFLQQDPTLQQAPPSFNVASPMAPNLLRSAPAPPPAAEPMAQFEVPPPPVDSAAMMTPIAALPTAPVAPTARPFPFARPKGLLTLRSMRVANAGSEGSKIFFGAGSEFAMGTDSAGNFILQQASAPSPLLNLDSQDTLHLGSTRVEAQALDALHGISVRGVKQWQLVYSDDFSVAGPGWSRSEVSQCAGVFMLGGFCKFSRGEVNKTYTGLPPHKQLRVVATYHFIDRWIGETGYMRLNVGQSDCPVTVWTEQHSQQEAKNGISLCGDAGTPEGKFSAPVDVTVPHHKDSVSVTFGSTMENSDPCDESWGVSSVEVYVRD